VLLGGDQAKVFVSSPSTISLPGYSELFSGRTPRCNSNDCGPTDENTLLDDWHSRDPSAVMALVSSWSRIPRVAARNGGHLLVSAGRTDERNLEVDSEDVDFRAALLRGRSASPVPGIDDYRPDRFTADIALRLLERRRPRFLFIGLGDTDEYAHLGSYDAYLQALRDADAVVERVEAWLESQRALRKRTLLIVTADHGRAFGFRHHGGAPEARRIWMLWSGHGVLRRGYPANEDSRLADVAPTLRNLIGLSDDWDSRAGRALSFLPADPIRLSMLLQIDSWSEVDEPR
jgi:hypothetical protein